MQFNLGNTAKNEIKNKISREDLLAGKCSPDEENTPEDPRFISPDAALEKYRRDRLEKRYLQNELDGTRNNGMISDGILRGSNQFEEKVPPEKDPFKVLDNGSHLEKPKAGLPASQVIRSMREQFESEITRWKLYEQQVNNWKDKVLKIVQDLNKNVQEKDQEIARLKAQIASE